MFKLVFVGKRFLLRGKKVKAIAETDSGNVRVAHANGNEQWTFDGELTPIDGTTKGFKVYQLPNAA